MIDDIKLSAFLDNELNDDEMQQVRDMIATDPQVAERVEQLAMADAQLNQAISAIDDRPLPSAISAMLDETSASANSDDTRRSESSNNDTTNNVLPFKRKLRNTATWFGGAVAACLVVVIGYQSGFQTGAPGLEAQIATALSRSASGATRQINGSDLRVHLSFTDNQGDYCRQFSLSTSTSRRDQVACLREGQWKIEADIERTMPQANEFQVASGPGEIDRYLDALGAQVISLENEQQLIKSNWEK